MGHNELSHQRVRLAAGAVAVNSWHSDNATSEQSEHKQHRELMGDLAQRTTLGTRCDILIMNRRCVYGFPDLCWWVELIEQASYPNIISTAELSCAFCSMEPLDWNGYGGLDQVGMELFCHEPKQVFLPFFTWFANKCAQTHAGFVQTTVLGMFSSALNIWGGGSEQVTGV